MEGDTADSLVALYRRDREISDVGARRYRLDDTADTRRGPVSLRWSLVPMIEATTRRAGHADIIREMIDWFVGD